MTSYWFALTKLGAGRAAESYCLQAVPAALHQKAEVVTRGGLRKTIRSGGVSVVVALPALQRPRPEEAKS